MQRWQGRESLHFNLELRQLTQALRTTGFSATSARFIGISLQWGSCGGEPRGVGCCYCCWSNLSRLVVFMWAKLFEMSQDLSALCTGSDFVGGVIPLVWRSKENLRRKRWISQGQWFPFFFLFLLFCPLFCRVVMVKKKCVVMCNILINSGQYMIMGWV